MDAGTVYATLGGRFDPAGFNAFGGAMYRARSQMEATERRQRTMAERSAASWQAMGHAAKIGAAGGIAAVGVAIGYSIKKAADFEGQLSSLRSVTGANERQLAALKKQALDAGAATKYSALQAAQAQTELAKGGLSTAKILRGGLQGALALAAAGEMDLADAAATTANALNLFKLGGDQATHVADALATAANTTTADVSDFALALSQGGAAAKAAGLDFDQTVAFLEALANAGVKGSDAGTSMKSALTQLASPTKQARAEMQKLGLSIFDTNGKIRPLPQLAEQLHDKLGKLTEQQRLQAATTLAGTDGMRALLALYGAGGPELERLTRGLERQGTAAQVAAQKQDNLKGKLENFTGSIETAGIIIGEHFLPPLTRGLEQATVKLNALAADGSLDRFATGALHAGATTVHVLGDVAHVAGDVIHTGGEVAGVLGDIGHALSLGDPGHIEAILAAVAGFKIAGFVAPMVIELANGLRLLATAPTVGALGADLLAMVNPVTAVAVGAGILAGALVVLSSREDQDARSAREAAEAHQRQAEAIKAVADAERAAADKGLAAQQSTLDLERARNELHDAATGKGGKDSARYREALIAERQAALRAREAHDDYNKSLEHQHTVNEQRIADARKRHDQTQQELADARKQVALEQQSIKTVGGKTIQRQANPEDVERLAIAQKHNTDAVKAYVQAVARAQVSDTSRMRLMNSASQITEHNAEGIAHLISAMDGLPTKKQTSILLTGDQAVLARLGDMAAQLTALGRRRTVASVLAKTDTAKAAVLAFKAILAGVPASKVSSVVAQLHGAAEVAALKRLIDGIGSKSVAIDVTTRYHQIGSPSPGAGAGTATPGGARRRAAGRGHQPGMERALVGEGRNPAETVFDTATGRGYVTTGPMVVDLPPTAYVIPHDGAYRGRAAQLLAHLAHDLGLPGYAPGRKAKHKGKGHHKVLPIPDRITYAAVDETEFNKQTDHARDAYKKRRDHVADYEKKVRADEQALHKAKTKDARKQAQSKLAADRRQLQQLRNGGPGLPHSLSELRAIWQEDSRELKALHKANVEIGRLQTIQETDRQKMENAAKAGDETAYLAAQHDRQDVLGKLKATYEKALALAKPNSTMHAQIDQALQTVVSDIADSGQTFADAVGPTAEPAEPELTAVQKALLAADDKDIALAALTAGLDDDTAAAGKKASDLQDILTSLLSGGQPASDSLIADVADQLKQARDNVTALTTGASSGSLDSDLQAQLDQAREQARVAKQEADINRQALEVFGGAGDLGSGGPNARQAAGGPTIVFQSYVPPSVQEAARLGGYVTGGLGAQGAVRSPRTVVK